MNLKVNPEPPEIMHIDLNSAFAMTEQQANPLLRGRPVGVTNRINDFAICITASYEAKQLGIGIGTRLREARMKAPDFVIVESDPAKYTFAHQKLRRIFSDYSPVAYMKSIDEGIIDFRGMCRLLKGRPLFDIAAEIKRRVREEVGDYMTVNIGLAQNRWLAKVAASFNKPDGLLAINPQDIEGVYSLLELTDLPYIKARNRLRLNLANIFTPLEFYRAAEPVLSKQVFQSIMGHHWYLKLRGYETEVEYGIRTVGRSYVLEYRTADPGELSTLFFKSGVKLARRLSKYSLAARGMFLALRYKQGAWSERRMYKTAARRGDQLFLRVLELFKNSPPGQIVTAMAMTAYALEPVRANQPALFEDFHARRERLEDAMDSVNDRYGDLTVAPATVVKSKNPMKDKIPFGSIRYFD